MLLNGVQPGDCKVTVSIWRGISESLWLCRFCEVMPVLSEALVSESLLEIDFFIDFKLSKKNASKI